MNWVLDYNNIMKNLGLYSIYTVKLPLDFDQKRPLDL